ncbi:hypothetical protein CBL_09829 [Carabus blaptoides fortunei]
MKEEVGKGENNGETLANSEFGADEQQSRTRGDLRDTVPVVLLISERHPIRTQAPPIPHFHATEPVSMIQYCCIAVPVELERKLFPRNERLGVQTVKNFTEHEI